MDKEGNIFGRKNKQGDGTFSVSLTPNGEGVKIRGTTAGKYVAMNENGNLYAQDNPNSDEVLFIENFESDYFQYESKKYHKWYLGIRKNGKPKKGHKTRSRQRATMWLKQSPS
ncbi:putative fibroblast growth factor 1 [Tachypleus tridentatus]|uniref:putative fibroblast growth factor 1 n=1 Tax=Tachypleus tridentatus TaxID=6853 RepID=UPI003FD46A14